MWYRLPALDDGEDGVVHINFGGARARAKAPKHCQTPYVWAHGKICGQMAGMQCDWKIPGGGTCDRYICPDCAMNVGPDKDLCPIHQHSYRLWLLLREESPCPTPSP